MSIDPTGARETLEDERGSLEHELEALTAVSRDPTPSIGFGKRVGEGTSEAIGRIERVAQAEALAGKLADVRRALEKLDEGSYGLCDRCRASIPDERLEARPSSVRCVPCSVEVL